MRDRRRSDKPRTVLLGKPGPAPDGYVELAVVLRTPPNEHLMITQILRDPKGLYYVHLTDGVTRAVVGGFYTRDELCSLRDVLNRELAS